MPNPQDRRRLFDVGIPANYTLPFNNPDAVDYTMQHRLLGKLLNNTTNRSNVFLVFVQLDYFEAAQVTDTGGTGKQVVRIGAKRADSPGYRGFYVIDRAKAVESVNAQALPDVATTGLFSFNQFFNYSPLVIHRERIK